MGLGYVLERKYTYLGSNNMWLCFVWFFMCLFHIHKNIYIMRWQCLITCYIMARVKQLNVNRDMNSFVLFTIHRDRYKLALYIMRRDMVLLLLREFDCNKLWFFFFVLCVVCCTSISFWSEEVGTIKHQNYLYGSMRD